MPEGALARMRFLQVLTEITGDDTFMRPFILVLLLIIFTACDIATTWYLLSNSLATELNPSVDPQSLATLILAPIPRLFSAVFLVCVVIAEKYSHQFDDILQRSLLVSYIFLFPIYLIFIAMAGTLNNLLLIAGLPTPLPPFIRFFGIFFESTHMQFTAAFSCLALATLPPILKIARRIYGPQFDATKAEFLVEK